METSLVLSGQGYQYHRESSPHLMIQVTKVVLDGLRSQRVRVRYRHDLEPREEIPFEARCQESIGT
jgi:hypothetical protein